MKIGVIAAVLPPELGGLGETVLAKHRWLASRGVEGRIITYSARKAKQTNEEIALGAEVTRYEPVARAEGSALQKLRDLRAMAPLLHDSLAGCDVIEMQGWSLWNSALALFPGPLAAKPWLMVYRGSDVGHVWLLDLLRPLVGSLAAMCMLVLPMMLVWSGLALFLGRKQRMLSDSLSR